MRRLITTITILLACSASHAGFARNIAKEQLSQGNYFESIVSEAEGFVPGAYMDNKGVAVAFGWNVSMQSSSFNRRVAKAIGLPKSAQETLARLSGVMTPESLPNVRITPKQGLQAVRLMRPVYEQAMRELVPSFDRLQPHERAALVYHAYKVGPDGAESYKRLLSALARYDQEQSDENRKAVAKTFTYWFTHTDDQNQVKRVKDRRAEIYISSLWMGHEQWEKVLSQKRPRNKLA